MYETGLKQFGINAPSLLYCCVVEHSPNPFSTTMEKFNFGYNVKNIPIPSEREYKIKLTEMIEAVIRRMRWKAMFFNGRDVDEETPENIKSYGLKSSKTPL